MPEYVAILEDCPGRATEMRACLDDLLPGHRQVFFDNAGEMLAWNRPDWKISDMRASFTARGIQRKLSHAASSYGSSMRLYYGRRSFMNI